MRLSDGPQKQRDGPAPVAQGTETCWLYVGGCENRRWRADGAGVPSTDRVGRCEWDRDGSAGFPINDCEDL